VSQKQAACLQPHSRPVLAQPHTLRPSTHPSYGVIQGENWCTSYVINMVPYETTHPGPLTAASALAAIAAADAGGRAPDRRRCAEVCAGPRWAAPTCARVRYHFFSKCIFSNLPSFPGALGFPGLGHDLPLLPSVILLHPDPISWGLVLFTAPSRETAMLLSSRLRPPAVRHCRRGSWSYS